MAKKPKPHELRSRDKRIAYHLERIEKPRQILPGRHLFVTEGTKTEPHYLEELINLISERHGAAVKKQIQIIGEGDNTLNLVRKAESYQHNAADDFQHVWIIYDKDDFPSDAFDNTISRCNALNKRFQSEGRDLTFHALWSNECFELWLLLHFCYMDSNISRDEYREKLSEYLGRHYEKADRSVFRDLLPLMEDALRNAHKLMQSYDSSAPASQKAPCTAFYELIEALRSYIQ